MFSNKCLQSQTTYSTHISTSKVPQRFTFAAQWVFFFPASFTVKGQVQGEEWLFWHLLEIYLILIYLSAIRANIFPRMYLISVT